MLQKENEGKWELIRLVEQNGIGEKGSFEQKSLQSSRRRVQCHHLLIQIKDITLHGYENSKWCWGQEKDFTESTTLWSVWFTRENCSGKQLVRSSARFQPESEGKEVLKSSFSLWRSDMLRSGGKQFKTSEGIKWSSWALLNKPGRRCRESRCMIFGAFVAMYTVKQRKRTNPIKCLKNRIY